MLESCFAAVIHLWSYNFWNLQRNVVGIIFTFMMEILHLVLC